VRKIHRRLATLVAVGAISLLVPAAASATSTPEQITTSRTAGVGYLKELQNKETGKIPGFGGDWSLTSFAAAGTAAAEVNKGGKSTTDARSWYETEVGNVNWPGTKSPPATEFERAALLAYAAGIDPARIGKRQDLIAKIASYYQPSEPGYYGTVFNETVFGLLAMTDTKTTTGLQRVPQPMLEESVRAVLANQHKDGGWTYAKVAGNPTAEAEASEPDMTGASMAALCNAGVANTNAAIVAGENYLASIFIPETGAFSYPYGVNTDSVAWAVDGLKACGIDPQAAPFTSTKYGKTPIDFLRSQQVSGGGFRYGTTGTAAEEYASQDAVRALGSGGFTATPPKPASGPQFKGQTEFTAKEATTLALIVNDGVHQLKLCSVTFTPKAAASTTLETVLKAAVVNGGTTPAGCLTQYAGSGAITQVNEYPATPAERWYLQVDGGTEEKATLTSAIHVGDTIYLRFK
jgi:hypothetical protein